MSDVTHEVKDLSAKLLTVDPEVQRNLDEGRVDKIAEAWDDKMAGVLVVSHRVHPFPTGDEPREEWVVLDGQTRLEAFRRVCGETTAAPLSCQVYEKLTKAEEAEIFLSYNDRKAVTPRDQFRLSLTAQKPDALAIHAITTKHGWIAQGLTAPDDGRTYRRFTAIGTVQKIYAFDEGKALDRTLQTINNAWPSAPGAVTSETLYGLGTLFHRHPGLTSKQVHGFVQKLSKIPPNTFIGDVISDRRRYRIATAGAAYNLVLGIYNTRRAESTRLDP